MRDYAELVKALRCCSKIDARNNGCDSCPYEYCGDDCQNLCGCAADAIEELLSKVLHWISVEERLTETDDFVIVAILDERGDTPYQYTDFGWYLDGAKCWIVNAEQRRDVTHWMPLPEPPKEVE